MTIRVLVADDQQLIRAGIVMLLRADANLQVVGEASNGREAVELALARQADVVVMDVRMPVMDGVNATRKVVEASQDRDQCPKVLILTTFEDDDAVYGALRAGASGYLLKHAVPNDLIAAVHRIAGGDSWIDPSVAGKVISALATMPATDGPSTGVVARLTPREREVLVLVARGMSNSEITQRLYLSEATVRTHVSRILMKTGSRDRAQAVSLAYQSGLVVAQR